MDVGQATAQSQWNTVVFILFAPMMLMGINLAAILVYLFTYYWWLVLFSYVRKFDCYEWGKTMYSVSAHLKRWRVARIRCLMRHLMLKLAESVRLNLVRINSDDPVRDAHIERCSIWVSRMERQQYCVCFAVSSKRPITQAKCWLDPFIHLFCSAHGLLRRKWIVKPSRAINLKVTTCNKYIRTSKRVFGRSRRMPPITSRMHKLRRNARYQAIQ